MLFRALNLIFAAAFVFAAVVQYNDPDPVAWTLVYGLAAVVSVVALLGKRPFAFPAVLGLVAFVWGAALITEILWTPEPVEDVGSWQMTNPGAELLREMVGLWLIAFWMLVLVGREVATIGKPARRSGLA